MGAAYPRIAAERIAATRDAWEGMGDCPFCSARAADFHISVTYSTDTDGVVREYMGECDQCAAMGPTATTPELAMRLWNARGSL